MVIDTTYTLANLVIVSNHVAVVDLVFRRADLGRLEVLQEKGVAGSNVHTETDYFKIQIKFTWYLINFQQKHMYIKQYMVAHLLANLLGWVDFDLCCSTICLVLVGNWQKWLSRWAGW